MERFKTMTKTYYRGAKGVILAYDCTSRASFENITNWVHQIKLHAVPGVSTILLGNKIDLIDQKEIDTEEAQEMAKRFGMKFFETSAKNGIGIEESFADILKTIEKNEISV